MTSHMQKSISTLVALIGLYSCGTVVRPFYSSEFRDWPSISKTSNKSLVHSLYLIGDAGRLDDIPNGENYVLNAAKANIEKSLGEETLVFLGDNVYDYGLAKKDHPERILGERILEAQLQLAQRVNGNTFFIPGNHDWKKSKKGGLKAVKRQEKYIESYFDEAFPHKVKMYPGKGCADPEVIKIHKDLVFVFLDTQWWLQNWEDEKHMNDGCEIKSKADLLHSIEEILTEHKNDEIVVLMHHPIMSNGTHGGHFSMKHHLFPLTEINKNLWIPLPFIGSAYPVYRQVSGSVQDITNGRNQEIVQGIDQIAKRLRVDVIFASGHEHSLQYFDQDKLKYIVSGSGANETYTAGGGLADYARQARGFAKLLFYEDFETWLEFYTVAGFNAEPVLEFRTQVREARAGTVETGIQFPDISPKDTSVVANQSFAAGKLKSLFMGPQYREMWATGVQVPIINLQQELGGLTPIKKGGGMSSNSLRMEVDNGKQYILRSINKDYTKLVPPQFANLKVINIMKDQNSASHPYGALVIPSLSKAANVYYTSPRLVYLKHQQGLGNYNSQFPEELYLLEQRPSGDWSDASQFGHSPNIIGYTDLLEIIRDKKQHFVDQKWVCKSRMFDMLIHDWDRHDDQWRWASFEQEDKVLYRPIPRDRDQAFYKFKGIVPTLIASSLVKKFKTMKGDVRDVKNLAFNARYFDRYFMNELEWADWEKIIEELQYNMTDESFEKAFQHIPKEVQHLDSKEIIEMLKSRRQNLKSIGKKLYDFISKEVEISGTDNDDLFEIDIKSNGNVQVKYWVKRKGKKDILKYDRTFYPDETKEIRMYGLRGKDDFIVQGPGETKIRIRIIGGEDKDEIKNESIVQHVIAYDDTEGLKSKGDKIKFNLSNEVENNEYIRNSFVYNTSLTLPAFGYTKDDGVWIGFFRTWKTQGWRKSPFKTQHTLGVQVAPGGQNTVKLSYDAQFRRIIGKLDFKPTVVIDFPSYENFFGYGNESVNELREKEFNWVRKRAIHIAPFLNVSSDNQQIHLHFGPVFESIRIVNSEGRVSQDELLGFSESDFERKDFLGFHIHHDINFLDRPSKPTNGLKLDIGAGFMKGLSSERSFFSFEGSVQTYLRIFNNPELVLANNVGFDLIEGEAEFYQLPNLGNNQNLRGYRNNRFRGNSAFFENVDLRLKLFESDNNLIPFDFGVLGGYDVGRVWYDGEDSDLWHQSYTAGVWFDLLGAAVLQPYYSWTDDENLISVRLGFNF